MITALVRALTWVRPQHRAPGQTPRMWWVWFSAPIVVAAAGVLTILIYLKLHSLATPIAVAGQAPAVDTLDVIKTTLSVAAFIGAVLAAIYAYRKQRLSEAESHRADAVQFGDRYTTAAGQLGHAEPPVRLAGVYALGRLADDWQDQRQTCIDVLCAYLRMPARRHEENDSDGASEREVRATIQRLIAGHLTPKKGEVDWCNNDFDFTGAKLEALAFDSVVSRGSIIFDMATFDGATRFFSAEFSGDTRFVAAMFAGDAQFYGARFAGDTRFSWATFTENTAFLGARFTGNAMFEQARFTGDTTFLGATFTGDTTFRAVRFSGDTTFRGATFNQLPDVEGMTFERHPELSGKPLHEWPEPYGPAQLITAPGA